MDPALLADRTALRPLYLRCSAQDQVVSLEWSRRIAHRIGADIVELPVVIHRSFHDRQRWLTSCCVWLKRGSALTPGRRVVGSISIYLLIIGSELWR